MIIFHPYRSLIGLFDAYGCSKDGGVGGGNGNGNGGLGVESEAFGVIKGLTAIEERDATEGLMGAGVRLAEFDEQVLQMCWFVLNDTYKTDIPLMYPPYMVALASLWLALTLHTPSYERINSSLHQMQLKRKQHDTDIASILNNPSSSAADLPKEEPTPPSEEALTFFASLNVSLPLLAEVVQEMVSGYSVQNEVARLVTDGPGVCKLLERMREARRAELVARAREGLAHR